MFVCAHALTHVCMCPIPDSTDAQGGLGEEGAEPPQGQPGALKNHPRQRLTLGLLQLSFLSRSIVSAPALSNKQESYRIHDGSRMVLRTP